MTVVITMAGEGRRFTEKGYTCPKYMICARGKTLFEWSLDSLKAYQSDGTQYIFVVKKSDNAKSFIDSICKSRIKQYQINEIDHLTDGQATTALLAIAKCDPETGILIYNIDTYVEPFAMQYTDSYGDGHIPCFISDGDHWSFVKTDNEGNVVEVREKERISEYCSIGAYYYSSVRLYREAYNEFYVKNNYSGIKERYIAPMYNYLLEKGYSVTMDIIPKEKVHILGTPEELEAFEHEDK